MISTQAPDPKARTLLAEAAAWRLTGLLLERPRAGWAEEVEALAREVKDAPRLLAASKAAGDATEETYIGLLGPGGFISPREVAYKKKEDPGRLLADISGFYEAFAFQPEAEDPADHISVQAGFVAYLHLKQAYALAQGEEEAASVTADAIRSFLESHLGTFAGPFAEALRPSGVAYLVETTRDLAERCERALAA